MTRFDRVVVVVLDSLGIGELPDAALFGDVGANTLRSIARSVPHLDIPELGRLGLGNIEHIPGIPANEAPLAAYGRLAEVSVGKDTMTGHWEIMGLHVTIPFRTYPQGFPSECIAAFERETGRHVIGNIPASGTEIIQQLGEVQLKTGAWIVYTSADSVFQLAAHEEIIPLEELYDACRVARRLMVGEHAVGRVIARPFIGKPGHFERTANRHDYAVKPPAPTMLNRLKNAGLDVIAIGKIADIFSGEGITQTYPTKSNQEGMTNTIEAMRQPFRGLCFTNLVDFDSLYGHRRDSQGYARALEQFDQQLPELMQSLGKRDLLILTADHGNDPSHPGTDHTREYVPLLAWSPALRGNQSLGTRVTFADIAATIADIFELEQPMIGQSFYKELT
jgi:phosphopentomutase